MSAATDFELISIRDKTRLLVFRAPYTGDEAERYAEEMAREYARVHGIPEDQLLAQRIDRP